jgi:hypothetical protein
VVAFHNIFTHSLRVVYVDEQDICSFYFLSFLVNYTQLLKVIPFKVNLLFQLAS